MVDSIYLRVNGYSFSHIDFEKFENYSESYSSKGLVIKGRWEGFTFSMKVETGFLDIQGSMAKHYFNGFNIQTLTYTQFIEICEKMSIAFDLPLEAFKISRLDFSTNFQTKLSISSLLASLPYDINRYQPSIFSGTSKSYRITGEKFIFYDKIIEAKKSAKSQIAKAELDKQLPPKGFNLLRFEVQLNNAKIKEHFQQSKQLTLNDLIQEHIYKKMVLIWVNSYRKINIIKQPIQTTSFDIYSFSLEFGITEKGKDFYFEKLKASYVDGNISKSKFYNQKKKLKAITPQSEYLFAEIDSDVAKIEALHK